MLLNANQSAHVSPVRRYGKQIVKKKKKAAEERFTHAMEAEKKGKKQYWHTNVEGTVLKNNKKHFFYNYHTSKPMS